MICPSFLFLLYCHHSTIPLPLFGNPLFIFFSKHFSFSSQFIFVFFIVSSPSFFYDFPIPFSILLPTLPNFFSMCLVIAPIFFSNFGFVFFSVLFPASCDLFFMGFLPLLFFGKYLIPILIISFLLFQSYFFPMCCPISPCIQSCFFGFLLTCQKLPSHPSFLEMQPTMISCYI